MFLRKDVTGEISLTNGDGVMTMETDVWQTAWIIVEQYGAEGVGFAEQMAKSFKIGGKADAQRVWMSIMEKVEILTLQEACDRAKAH
jgi:hypothetical protein